MKKLVVFAIAAVVAIAAQAASFTWACSQVRDGWDTGANKVDGTAYLFLVGNNGVTEAGIAELISSSASTAELGTSLLGKAIDNTELSLGAASSTTSELAATAPASLFMVVISGDNAYQSAAITVPEIAALGATEVAFGSQKNATNNSAAWSSVGGGGDVPEPTSGLLLLVGGALLALRRKQK